MKSKFENTPLILHGVSFGAFHLIRATGHLPKGSTIVLENVSRSLEDYWNKSKVTSLAIKILKNLNPDFIRDMDVLSYLTSAPSNDYSFVLIACDKDTETPESEMRDYVLLMGEKVSMHTFNNADHLEAPAKDSDKYSKIIANVIAKTWNNEE